jgi:DNA-binding transcriptional ArsR family regulator
MSNTISTRSRPERRGRESAAGSSPASESSAKWTFLTNHSHVLVVLNSDPEMVLREVALHVGITERAVQRIIQDLERDGYIERERVGRRNRYRVQVDRGLRHPIESHRSIGDLLNLVGPESK